MIICKTIPPFFDEETIGIHKSYNQMMKEEKVRQLNRWPEDKVDRFLALGLSKGSVVFVTVDETD